MRQWVAMIDYDDGNDPRYVGPFLSETHAIEWLTEFGYWDDDEVWSAAYPLDSP